MAAAISRIRSLPVGAARTDCIAQAPYARPIKLQTKIRTSAIVIVVRTFWRNAGDSAQPGRARGLPIRIDPQQKDGGSYAKAFPPWQAAQGLTARTDRP